MCISVKNSTKDSALKPQKAYFNNTELLRKLLRLWDYILWSIQWNTVLSHLVATHSFMTFMISLCMLLTFVSLWLISCMVLTLSVSSSCGFSAVQSLSCIWLCATPWTAAHQASLSITSSRSSPKPVSNESVMPSSHLTLCCPLLLPSVFPSIRVFSEESALRISWPKYRCYRKAIFYCFLLKIALDSNEDD